MKKSILILFLLLRFPFFSSAQNTLVKMWDKTFGGLNDDEPAYFQQTSDGGYIIGGYTYSDAGGNKTSHLKNSTSIQDYWIVKIDSMGVMQWDKDLGGANGEQFATLQQTADGGYIVGGSSASNISGDKTQASWGNFDYWVVKLDALGNILWDKDFGGTASDQLASLCQTFDGGYILAGSSSSGVGGNKNEPGQGALDYWILKIDANGNKLWDKTFGGSDADKLSTIHQTKDHGFILGGSSWSPISGDKTEANFGMDDYWVVKTDSLGNKQWDKDFGGTDSDKLFALLQTKDNGYVFAGKSNSTVSGNKTQMPWGGYDFWLVKTDPYGHKEWDKNFGGTDNEDEFGTIAFTADGGYLISGTSYSPISGDKTELNLGLEQTWFVKADSLFNRQWDKTAFTSCHNESGMAIETSSGQCYAVINTNGPGCGTGGYLTQSSWNNSRDFWIVKFCDSTMLKPVSSWTAAHNLCPGTCTSFTNHSQNSSSYQWSFPGGNPSVSTQANPTNICYNTPGHYNVTLIAGNAYGTDTLSLANYITVFPYPAPLSIVQHGDSLIVNTGGTAYQWYLNGNVINGATNYFYIANTNGNYDVIVNDDNGCQAEAAIYSVMTNIESVNGEASIDIYPNPVEDKFTIHSSRFKLGTATAVTIYNSIGEKIFSENNFKDQHVDCKSFAPGAYLLEVKNEATTIRKKFIKQ